MSRLLQSRSSKEAIGDEKKNVEEIFFLGFTVCKTRIFFFYKFIWFTGKKNIFFGWFSSS